MLKVDAREVLEGEVDNALSEMAMIFPDQDDDARESLPDGDTFVAQLGFDGPQKGELRIALARGLAVEFAAGFMGLDPDDPDVDDAALDAAGELLNVVSGRFMTSYFGEQPAVTLEPPRTRLGGWADDGWDGEEISSVAFDCDGHALVVGIRFKSDRSED